MCVKIPCGYSLQTIIKALAAFEIVISTICLILSGVFTVLCFVYPFYLLSVLNYEDHELSLLREVPHPPSMTDWDLDLGPASNWTSTSNETHFDVFAIASLASINKTENQLQNSSSTLTINLIDTVELLDAEINDTSSPTAIEDLEDRDPDDFLRFMIARSSFQASVMAVVLVYFLCGLTLAVLLLSAAQERHPQKLTVWMLLQSLAHVIRLVLAALLIYWMTDTEKRLDVVLCFLLMNFYSLTVFSIVRGYRQEILALYKRNNRATHARAPVNDPGVLKQRFIRNV